MKPSKSTAERDNLDWTRRVNHRAVAYPETIPMSCTFSSDVCACLEV